MSTQNIIIAVIVLVALGAGTWWVVSDPVGDAARSAIEQTPDVTPAEQMSDEEALPSGMGRLMDLYERGVPMECTFTYSDETGSGEGASYFDGEQMRVSAMYEENGTTFVSDIINDGTMMYVWGESPGGDFAIKMLATEEDMMDIDDDLDDATMLDEEVEYDCREWSVDRSVFNPPADIEFMDMGTVMEDMMQGMPDMEDMDMEELEALMEDMMQGMP